MRKKLNAGKDRKDCGCQEKSWRRREKEKEEIKGYGRQKRQTDYD
jgi:hypothetical protein